MTKRFLPKLFILSFAALGLVMMFGKDSHKTAAPLKPILVQSSNRDIKSESKATQTAGKQQEPDSSKSPKISDFKNPATRAQIEASGYIQHRYTALTAPNDTYYSSSWYHQKIQSNRAWDVTTGSNSSVVAVIDTGFGLTHSDLVNKWYANPGEQGMTSSGDHCWTGEVVDKKTNGCDDDQNGYVDDWRGWDFVAADNDPMAGQTDPNGGGVEHATMVSGLIAASANNNFGNAGINWQAKVMPLQVLGDDGSGYTFDIVAAIDYAVDNGANIINLSLGGPDFDQMMLDAVSYAEAHNVLVVAAAGNCGNSSTGDCAGYIDTGHMSYPAKYPSVFSVGATTSTDTRASFSSFGSALDISAPGSSVGPLAVWDSLSPTNSFVSSASGTSFSSPIVAGIASLVQSELTNPTPEKIRTILMQSADKVSGMSGQKRTDNYGYGRVNAHKATLLAQAINSPPSSLGQTQLQGRQPPKGAILRSTTGLVQSDEWFIILCQVEASDTCSGSIQNGSSLLTLSPTEQSKGSELYYMFAHGADMATGASTVAIHSRNYAAKVVDISK